MRCQRCLLPQARCLCHMIQPRASRSRFCLIMFDTEPLKPSNTGRLIADILPETQAFLWSRTSPDPRLLAALQTTDYQPYLVFLADDARDTRQAVHCVATDAKPPLFVLLDGTWPEARKMFRKSPYLNALPLLSLEVNSPSRYHALREASGAGQHCTAEIAAALLRQSGDEAAAEALAAHFERFRLRYLEGKTHRPEAEIGPSSQPDPAVTA